MTGATRSSRGRFASVATLLVAGAAIVACSDGADQPSTAVADSAPAAGGSAADGTPATSPDPEDCMNEHDVSQYSLESLAAAADLVISGEATSPPTYDAENTAYVSVAITTTYAGDGATEVIDVAAPCPSQVAPGVEGFWFLAAPAAEGQPWTSLDIGPTPAAPPGYSERSVLRVVAGLPATDPVPGVDELDTLVAMSDIVAHVLLEPSDDRTSGRIVYVMEVMRGPDPPAALMPEGVPGPMAGGPVVSPPASTAPGGPWTIEPSKLYDGMNAGMLFIVGTWDDPHLINPAPPQMISSSYTRAAALEVADG